MSWGKGGEKLPEKRPSFPGNTLSELERNVLKLIQSCPTTWSDRGGLTSCDIAQGINMDHNDILLALTSLIERKLVVRANSEIIGCRYYLTKAATIQR